MNEETVQLNLGKQPKERADIISLKIQEIKTRALAKGLNAPSQKALGGLAVQVGITFFDVWLKSILSAKESWKTAKAEVLEDVLYEEFTHELVKMLGADEIIRDLAHEFAEALRYGGR